MTLLVLAVLAVVLASALCSGSEAALLAMPDMRARLIAEERGGAASVLLGLKENIDRPIAAIVVLNNVANIVGSIVVGGIATEVLGSAYLGIFSACLTFAIILFSEIIPKTLGTRYPEQISLFIARPLRGLTVILTPLLWCLERVTSLLGGEVTAEVADEATLRFMVRESGRADQIEQTERDMIIRVFSLNDLTAADIMTPRTQMTYLRAGLSARDQEAAIKGSQHSRIVLVGETLDDVKGIVLLRDLLLSLINGGHMPEPTPAHYVSPDMPADELMRHFLPARNHIAVVKGQWGEIQGVVTLEDVLEIVVGEEIVDETDVDADLQQVALRRAQG